MKKHMNFLPTLMTLLASFSLTAQVEWRGGFPGRETDWQCARNWSDNRVPNNLDDVIIPDCSARGNFYPVISRQPAEVQSLLLDNQARMTIAAGAQLSVFGYDLPDGALLNLGTIENNGLLQVYEPVMHAVEYSGKGQFIHVMSDIKPDICEVECTPMPNQ